MARSLTVAQLIDRGKKRADMEDSDLLSDAEWQQNLSQVFGELYEEVADSGMRYYETEETITTDGSASYALPSDHFSSIGLDYLDGTRRVEVEEGMIDERNRYSGSSGGRASQWAMVGANIVLYPTPASGQTYYHVYVPQPADLSAVATSTSLDVITPAGEAFIVWGLSALAKAKEESDVRLDMAERARAFDRLRDWAMKRSLITPRRSMMEDDGLGYGTRYRDPGDYRY